MRIDLNYFDHRITNNDDNVKSNNNMIIVVDKSIFISQDFMAVRIKNNFLI
jgi:hypothetical protein